MEGILYDTMLFFPVDLVICILSMQTLSEYVKRHSCQLLDQMCITDLKCRREQAKDKSLYSVSHISEAGS